MEEKVEDTKKQKPKKKPENEVLKEKIKKLEVELKEAKEEALKELASVHTLRRRLQEEADNNKKYAPLKIIEELLNPIDMLLNIVNTDVESEEIKNYLIGFKMIADQLMQVLTTAGLKQIECKENDLFNSDTMEALSKEEIDTDEAKVLKVFRNGYYFLDRIIRPTSVHVGVKKEIKEEKGEE